MYIYIYIYIYIIISTISIGITITNIYIYIYTHTHTCAPVVHDDVGDAADLDVVEALQEVLQGLLRMAHIVVFPIVFCLVLRGAGRVAVLYVARTGRCIIHTWR